MRIRELTPRQVEVVRAVLDNGCDRGAAARALGIKPNSVKQTVEAAIDRVRAQHVTDLRPHLESSVSSVANNGAAEPCQGSVSGRRADI
ncbi:MAG: hypothetical protein WCC59_15085 [Terriglobales bacterium]